MDHVPRGYFDITLLGLPMTLRTAATFLCPILFFTMQSYDPLSATAVGHMFNSVPLGEISRLSLLNKRRPLRSQYTIGLGLPSPLHWKTTQRLTIIDCDCGTTVILGPSTCKIHKLAIMLNP